MKTSFTLEEARKVAEQLGIDFNEVDFTAETFMEGMNVELEHGTRDPETDVTGDNPETIGKIALAHLRESGKYYDALEKMEQELER